MNRKIEENYQIISAVNLGGAHRMYVAENIQKRTRWAIREIRKTEGTPADCLRRAQAVQNMNDPLLPQICEIHEDDDTITVVEEYIPGVSLSSFVEQTDTMDESDVLVWMGEIAGFLHRIHSLEGNVVFGALEPVNLRLMPDNSVRIADYSPLCGLGANIVSDAEYGYKAPEQRNGGPLGPWTDIYSLASVAYYALTGKDPDDRPYRFFPLRRLNRKASSGIEYILNKCLQQNPKKRYQSAAELLYDLQRIKRFNKVLSGYKFKRAMRKLTVWTMVLGGCAMMVWGLMTMKTEMQDNYRILINNAAVLADEGDYTTAFTKLDEAQLLMPEDVRAYEARAELMYAMGDYVGCAEYSTAQLAAFPESKSLVLHLAMSDYALGEYRLAYEYFRLAGVENMDQHQLGQYVISLIRLDRTADAGVLYSENAGKWDFALAYYIQGELYAAQGELDEAVAALTGAMNESADDALTLDCILLLADIYTAAAESEDDSIDAPLTAAAQLLEGAVNDHRFADETELLATYARVLALTADDDADWGLVAQIMEKVYAAGQPGEEDYLLLCSALSNCGEHEKALDLILEAEAKYQSSWRIRARAAWEEIVLQSGISAELRDYSAAYGEYTMAESLIGDDEADELMEALRAKISDLREIGYISE